ncbi:MAG: hypothetical protein US89_C0007G0016 [Candidatus Peregrinibacteria bacterium GW2011_GWF2_38_29]|nr:MAG: hypothetical protein US89_C0007G0016 [Candidatus Peregrinibacteria bacterium GW2011_GWF2_38_29]
MGALERQGFVEEGDTLILRANGNHLHVNVHNPAQSAISNNPKDGAIWVRATNAQGKEAFTTRLPCVLP